MIKSILILQEETHLIIKKDLLKLRLLKTIKVLVELRCIEQLGPGSIIYTEYIYSNTRLRYNFEILVLYLSISILCFFILFKYTYTLHTYYSTTFI